MGEKLTKLLDCDEKEVGYDDSDEEIDEKISANSNKTYENTRKNSKTHHVPPNTYNYNETQNKNELLNQIKKTGLLNQLESKIKHIDEDELVFSNKGDKSIQIEDLQDNTKIEIVKESCEKFNENINDLKPVHTSFKIKSLGDFSIVREEPQDFTRTPLFKTNFNFPNAIISEEEDSKNNERYFEKKDNNDKILENEEELKKNTFLKIEKFNTHPPSETQTGMLFQKVQINKTNEKIKFK